jgi:hypothetical protein
MQVLVYAAIVIALAWGARLAAPRRQSMHAIPNPSV